MTSQIFKTILAGILAGIAVFMLPFFIIKVLVFFLLIKAVFRLLGGRRRYWRMHPAYAHHCSNMTEDQRKEFMAKYARGCGHYHQNDGKTKEDSEAV